VAFSVAVPLSWHAYQSASLAAVRAPGRPLTLTVEEAPPAAADLRAAARALQQRDAPAAGLFASRPGMLRAFRLTGGPAASWTMSWDKPGGGQMRMQDVVFPAVTPAGQRFFSVRLTAPVADWQAAQPVLVQALRTVRSGS
jgi:hypothetical protein